MPTSSPRSCTSPGRCLRYFGSVSRTGPDLRDYLDKVPYFVWAFTLEDDEVQMTRNEAPDKFKTDESQRAGQLQGRRAPELRERDLRRMQERRSGEIGAAPHLFPVREEALRTDEVTRDATL